MRILALETTAITGSVALLEHEQLVHEIVLRDDQRSAQSLAPAIEAALQAVAWPLASIQLMAIAIGPGSFTGLRVGITTAKMFSRDFLLFYGVKPTDFQRKESAHILNAAG